MPIHLNPASSRLSRRSFLGGLAAGALSGCVSPAGRPKLSPEREASEAVWALLADPHIHESPDKLVRGSNMTRNLEAIVPRILNAGAQHVLFNGDVAFATGRRADYDAFKRIIKPLYGASSALHFTLGNHDARGNFVAALTDAEHQPVEDKHVSTTLAGGVNWVMLDSLERVNAISGSLGGLQLRWLERQLDSHADMPTIVCLHHNPERSFAGLTDAQMFLDVVIPRRHVKAVIFGHTHRYRLWSQDGLHFLNLPAAGYRFNPLNRLGWVLTRTNGSGMSIEVRDLTGSQMMDGRTLEWRRDGHVGRPRGQGDAP